MGNIKFVVWVVLGQMLFQNWDHVWVFIFRLRVSVRTHQLSPPHTPTPLCFSLPVCFVDFFDSTMFYKVILKAHPSFSRPQFSVRNSRWGGCREGLLLLMRKWSKPAWYRITSAPTMNTVKAFTKQHKLANIVCFIVSRQEWESNVRPLLHQKFVVRRTFIPQSFTFDLPEK